MARSFLWLVPVLMLTATCRVFAGELTASVSDSGIVVPMAGLEWRAHVLDHRVTITLPEPMRTWQDPAVIRGEYVLRSDAKEPLTISVGWPTAGMPVRHDRPDRPDPECVPYIKLDGEPVACDYLTFDHLAEPYVQPWMERIDKLLESKPALKTEIARIREENPKPGEGWLAYGGVYELQRWLRGEGRSECPDPCHADILAKGLLAVPSSGPGNRRDHFVQSALTWLDPSHEWVDLYDILWERWDHDARLLDPVTGQLTDVGGGLSKPMFGLFRFPITLDPGQKHSLVVQYGQFLGYSGDTWGLVHLMEPAERWGRWGKTTIEIKVPTRWKTVAIRPPPKKVATRGGFTTYRIVMTYGPCENLYVSVE